MFYRRKIILALLQAFGGELSKTSLQKLLFLFTQRQSKREYDFVPYKYGCYSFSASADLSAMVKHGQLSEDQTNYSKVDMNDYAKMLNEGDKKILVGVRNSYASLSASSLMKLTYLNYKYYAINSVKAFDVLSPEQYADVVAARPIKNHTTLYTIGYEGISLEAYLNRLIRNDVKVLIDVRNNPISMKYGFSKKQLKGFVEGLGIEYLHIPEVGIQSDQRKELRNQEDYDELFDIYKNHNLKNTKTYQEIIFDLLQSKNRVALTCFEANICQCHRKHLAEAIANIPEWEYELKHI
ncbi:DUF488 family protein [Dyadobacter endophyticus]|uniref:DUF488 family protein n=1 Tax=Dyadobacter endophyticus TaxID=1749036 RepID=UPI003CF32F7D